MIIVAGGDSFVYGNELKDCDPIELPTSKPSKTCYSALVSESYKYVCVAEPGFANDSIARTTITACEKLKNEKLAVIVTWTFTGRYEFNFSFTDQADWQIVNHWTVNNQFYEYNKNQIDNIEFYSNQAKNSNLYDFATNFYKHIGASEYWETYHSLKEIVFLQSYLKSKNIPFFFTCVDSIFLNNYSINSQDPTLCTLKNLIDFDHWFLFPNNKGFYQWAVDNKYPIGDTHPLEEAHRDAAELMKDKFYELVTKHLE